MTHPRKSIRVLQEKAAGAQVGYCTVRKTDVSDALAHIAHLENETPWPALRAIAFGEASEDDYKALEGWLFDVEPEVEHAGD